MFKSFFNMIVAFQGKIAGWKLAENHQARTISSLFNGEKVRKIKTRPQVLFLALSLILLTVVSRFCFLWLRSIEGSLVLWFGGRPLPLFSEFIFSIIYMLNNNCIKLIPIIIISLIANYPSLLPFCNKKWMKQIIQFIAKMREEINIFSYLVSWSAILTSVLLFVLVPYSFIDLIRAGEKYLRPNLSAALLGNNMAIFEDIDQYRVFAPYVVHELVHNEMQKKHGLGLKVAFSEVVSRKVEERKATPEEWRFNVRVSDCWGYEKQSYRGRAFRNESHKWDVELVPTKAPSTTSD